MTGLNGTPLPAGDLFDIRQAEARRRARDVDHTLARLALEFAPKDQRRGATYQRVLNATSTDGTISAEEHAALVTAVVMRARRC